jgi:hypothetical protein
MTKTLNYNDFVSQIELPSTEKMFNADISAEQRNADITFTNKELIAAIKRFNNILSMHNRNIYLSIESVAGEKRVHVSNCNTGATVGLLAAVEPVIFIRNLETIGVTF